MSLAVGDDGARRENRFVVSAGVEVDDVGVEESSNEDRVEEGDCGELG